MTPRADSYNAREVAEGRILPAHLTALTRATQRVSGLDPDGYCGPQTRAVLDGWSPVATPSRKPWSGRPRPERWLGHVHGLVVHTTGSRIVKRAVKRGADPVRLAAAYYERSTGTTYVIDYDGTIWQVASEHERAWGVGTHAQIAAERDPRGWQAVVSPVMARLWTDVWGTERTPLSILPAHPNACMAHVEVVPLPRARRLSEAAAPGLWYTEAQHRAVATLAVDIARRNDFAHIANWWLPGQHSRLVEHADITPASRSDKHGSWDLGGRRLQPRFDWQRVFAACERAA